MYYLFGFFRALNFYVSSKLITFFMSYLDVYLFEVRSGVQIIFLSYFSYLLKSLNFLKKKSKCLFIKKCIFLFFIFCFFWALDFLYLLELIKFFYELSRCLFFKKMYFFFFLFLTFFRALDLYIFFELITFYELSRWLFIKKNVFSLFYFLVLSELLTFMYLLDLLYFLWVI